MTHDTAALKRRITDFSDLRIERIELIGPDASIVYRLKNDMEDTGERITFADRIRGENYPEINMEDFLDVMKGGKIE